MKFVIHSSQEEGTYNVIEGHTRKHWCWSGGRGKWEVGNFGSESLLSIPQEGDPKTADLGLASLNNFHRLQKRGCPSCVERGPGVISPFIVFNLIFCIHIGFVFFF